MKNINLKSLSTLFPDVTRPLLHCCKFSPDLVQILLSTLMKIVGMYSVLCCCSVAKLCLTLREPHGLKHARLPCFLPSPRVCLNSCPLSEGCYPTISSSVTSFSSCIQSFPESGSFPISWLLATGGQSIGASASVLTITIQDWFLFNWLVWSPV